MLPQAYSCDLTEEISCRRPCRGDAPSGLCRSPKHSVCPAPKSPSSQGVSSLFETARSGPKGALGGAWEALGLGDDDDDMDLDEDSVALERAAALGMRGQGPPSESDGSGERSGSWGSGECGRGDGEREKFSGE